MTFYTGLRKSDSQGNYIGGYYQTLGFDVKYERHVTCRTCPLGATCEWGLVTSKPNYYGILDEDKGNFYRPFFILKILFHYC